MTTEVKDLVPDHEVIWLEPSCAEANHRGRTWCKDNAWDDCPECGAAPTKYVRADLCMTKEAEIIRLRSTLAAAESRATAAEGRVAVLEEALTPSTETKAAYIGEFYMGVTLMARGQEDHRRVQVPWTSIKEIMAAIKAYADESSRARLAKGGQ